VNYFFLVHQLIKHVMKNPISLIFIFLLLLGSCVEDWFNNKIPTTKIEGLTLEFQRLKFCAQAVHFVNEQTGYLGCGNVVSKTVDGGTTWTYSEIESKQEIHDMYFVNEQIGFMVSNDFYCGINCALDSAMILHTIDSGKTWSHTAMPTTALLSIWFTSETSGFAVSPTAIFATTDGGDSWEKLSLDAAVEGLREVQFIDDQKGFITTGAETFLRTTDGGKNWDVLSAPFTTIGTLSLVRDNLIVFVPSRYGNSIGPIYRSLDLGNTWEEFAKIPTGFTHSLIFLTDDIAYAVGGGANSSSHDDSMLVASIYYTTDGGVTWKGSSIVRESPIITTFHFPTPNVGYASGGVVLSKIMKQ
jgi:photosystem II stability/assembly factor-like uncharacterized protein